jgi:sugar-specific transcriptional regulator TrmB
MKKILLCLLCLGMCFSIAGCGKSNEEKKQEELQKLQEMKIPQTSELDGFSDEYIQFISDIEQYKNMFDDSYDENDDKFSIHTKDSNYILSYYHTFDEETSSFITTTTIGFVNHTDENDNIPMLHYYHDGETDKTIYYSSIDNRIFNLITNQEETPSGVGELSIDEEINMLKVKEYYNDFLEHYSLLNIERINKMTINILSQK